MKSPTKVHLLIIDPQNDFCDIPMAEQASDPLAAGRMLAPALPVAGAGQDMKRLAAFIDRVGSKLSDIHVTMDSHNPVDIAHPTWWSNGMGESPAPFTVITAKDLDVGLWRPRNPLLQERSRHYLEQLELAQRYALVVWPEHCLIGHWGHNVHAAVAHSLDAWARKKLDVVDYVTKGSNPFTEHYSAVQAEVPDPSDPGTLLNSRLINTLSDADVVIVAGEALSHCVANTVRDIANNFGEDNIKKLVLLTDCCNSVGGFEQLGSDFVAEMQARGMRTARSVDYML
jgi:nicotinamidase-related amidase